MTDTINDSLLGNLQNQLNNTTTPGDSPTADKLFDDFDDFLILLTTQLQNQDPLSPLETSEFTNQLVGFANVEQQLAQTEQLKAMAANLDAQNRISAVNHIGKNVEYEGDEFSLEGDTASIGYILPEDTGRANIKIYDEDDDIVASYTLNNIEPGERKNFEWDGYRIASGDDPRAFRLNSFDGGATSQAVFEYALPENTNVASLVIRNGDGTIVATESVSIADGRNSFIWDGKRDNGSGARQQLPLGQYSYEIKAEESASGPEINGVKVYEVLPAGLYRSEITVNPVAGAEQVRGDVRQFSQTQVTGVNGRGSDIVLELATGGEVKINDILRALL